MSFVGGNILLSISLTTVEKNLFKVSDLDFGLVSIRLFIFRNAICLFDLIFTIISDLTAAQVC